MEEEIKVSDMPVAETLVGLVVLGVSESQSVQVPIALLKGNVGATPNLTIQVTALASGATPTVQKSGTAENPILVLGIPAGPAGPSRGDCCGPGPGTGRKSPSRRPSSSGGVFPGAGS